MPSAVDANSRRPMRATISTARIAADRRRQRHAAELPTPPPKLDPQRDQPLADLRVHHVRADVGQAAGVARLERRVRVVAPRRLEAVDQQRVRVLDVVRLVEHQLVRAAQVPEPQHRRQQRDRERPQPAREPVARASCRAGACRRRAAAAAAGPGWTPGGPRARAARPRGRARCPGRGSRRAPRTRGQRGSRRRSPRRRQRWPRRRSRRRTRRVDDRGLVGDRSSRRPTGVVVDGRCSSAGGSSTGSVSSAGRSSSTASVSSAPGVVDRLGSATGSVSSAAWSSGTAPDSSATGVPSTASVGLVASAGSGCVAVGSAVVGSSSGSGEGSRPS